MKNFKTWQLTEGHIQYNPRIDGEPLQPKTAMGAALQCEYLATQIRTTFGLDERFAAHRDAIHKCGELLEQAAREMYKVLVSDPHKFS
jgi:hypothetical protein